MVFSRCLFLRRKFYEFTSIRGEYDGEGERVKDSEEPLFLVLHSDLFGIPLGFFQEVCFTGEGDFLESARRGLDEDAEGVVCFDDRALDDCGFFSGYAGESCKSETESREECFQVHIRKILWVVCIGFQRLAANSAPEETSKLMASVKSAVKNTFVKGVFSEVPAGLRRECASSLFNQSHLCAIKSTTTLH